MKKTSDTKIVIKNAQFYAFHGVNSEERKLGGKYQVDLEIFYNATQAIVNDDVNFAINYEVLLFEVSEIVANENYNLIETIANEILNMFLEKFPMVVKATVRVRKANAPIKQIVDYIEVEQTIERD